MAKDGSEQAQGELATLMRDLHGELLLGGSRRIKHLAGRALELRYIAWPLVEGETVVSLVKRDGRVVSKESVGGPGPFLDETDNPLQSDLMVVYDVCRKLLADRPVDPDVVEALANRFPLPTLSKKAAVALEILRNLPPEQALTGPRLIDALSDHDDGVDTDQATLTGRIIPALRPYGVENIPRLGYRVAPHRR